MLKQSIRSTVPLFTNISGLSISSEYCDELHQWIS